VGLTTDYIGTARTGSPDIGAYEFIQSILVERTHKPVGRLVFNGRRIIDN
jgi:hypothetical protein